jgi:hypothetical protein
MGFDLKRAAAGLTMQHNMSLIGWYGSKVHASYVETFKFFFVLICNYPTFTFRSNNLQREIKLIFSMQKWMTMHFL